MWDGARVVDEIESPVRPPGRATFRAVKVRPEIRLETGVIDSQPPGQRHQVHAGRAVALPAVDGKFVASGDHLADRADREWIANVGDFEHGPTIAPAAPSGYA